MRERLIEIMQEWGNKNQDSFLIESVADHLLANGVVALPCKLGDTVWVISRDTTAEHKVEKIEIDYGGKVWIFYHWAGSAYEMKSIKEIGKTVFLTKEDAEAEMKRRERE